MDVTIQFEDGTKVVVDHTKFYETIGSNIVYRFSIGSADFYNYDMYALEDLGDRLKISMWELNTSYPEQSWPELGHAFIYEVFSPDKWIRTQYGDNQPDSWKSFQIPPEELHIKGSWVANTISDSLRADWPITKLTDYSKIGI